MPGRVRLHAEFAGDIRTDLHSVFERDHPEWFVLLEEDLTGLIALLEVYPRLGRLRAQRRGRELRVFRLKQVPYSGWYVVEPRGVMLLELAHHGQRARRRRQW